MKSPKRMLSMRFLQISIWMRMEMLPPTLSLKNRNRMLKE